MAQSFRALAPVAENLSSIFATMWQLASSSTPVPGNPMPLSNLLGLKAHTQCT